MMEKEYDVVDPSASALIESLRSVGYNTPTAIADVVDNSISAGASEVDIHFKWAEGDSYVTISDNGHGMSEKELKEAMRAGSRSPLEQRSPEDLGRFGLGLKTASFSKGRALTVASCREGAPSFVRCWDLNYVERKNQWRLLKRPHELADEACAELDSKDSGTTVIWNSLDRLLKYDDHETADDARKHFTSTIRDVAGHLSMVFHRFLSGEAGPKRRLRITVNGQKLDPWDPFSLSHEATQNLGTTGVDFRETPVEVVGYVLPHKSKLSDEEFESMGGPKGWAGQQGFYVYRNHRLLVAGDWLGLGYGGRWRKAEQTRLARIRLDIRNQTDQDWQLDIKKSTARPPAALRHILTKVGEAVRTRAVRVFRHRGEIETGNRNQDDKLPWLVESTGSGSRYKVNREHPIVEMALKEAGRKSPEIESAFRLLEATVPVEQIWLDVAEENSSPAPPFAELDPDVVRVDVKRMVEFLIDKGMDRESAVRSVRSTHPYSLPTFAHIFDLPEFR